jgi:ubiquinone/menaquinone biosynthesis C-methylase UbiE
MRQDDLSELRRALLTDVRGEVLEIGFGTGLNLPHYPSEVKKLTTVDPNPGMSALAKKRIAASPIPVETLLLDAERLPFPDRSFDSVVSTWTLCSIPNIDQALREIHRVLKPSGRFFFLEHGLSHEAKVRKWQHRFTPLSKRFADGCHLNREIQLLIEEHFKVVRLDRFYQKGAPKIAGYFYRGIAEKR